MCRLLGYVGAAPLSAVEALGREAFDSFAALSFVHRDGWGMAWRTPYDLKVATSPGTAAEDERFATLASTPLSDAGIVHLRWATDGLVVGPENTHPFSARGLALAHNGSIHPIDRLESMLSERARGELRGTTDSERYFQFVLDRIDALGDEEEGVQDAARRMAAAFPYCSLNALVLSGTALYAIHVNSRAAQPLDDLRELFGSDDRMPAGHASEYFSLSYRVDERGVQIVSTGLDQTGWTSLPPDSILKVDLAARTVDVTPLGDLDRFVVTF